MKIVKLKGGLGNQMFQYAFAKLIEKETGDEVKIDLSTYSDLNGDEVRKPRIQKFKLSLSIATPQDIRRVCRFNHTGNSQSNKYRMGLALESLFNMKYLFEKNHSCCTIGQMKSVNYFDGYWQDWQFVDSIMYELEKDFVPLQDISDKSKAVLTKIESCNSVFVGIRRGDYLTVKPEHYGIFDQDYYDRAMTRISDKVENPVFFIFSNDINWVKGNMDFTGRDVAYITDTVDDFEDFILMTKCKHSIIPNSTYHWWGARRNEYPEKIIVAPSKWFADDAPITILPDRWEKV